MLPGFLSDQTGESPRVRLAQSTEQYGNKRDSWQVLVWGSPAGAAQVCCAGLVNKHACILLRSTPMLSVLLMSSSALQGAQNSSLLFVQRVPTQLW